MGPRALCPKKGPAPFLRPGPTSAVRANGTDDHRLAPARKLCGKHRSPLWGPRCGANRDSTGYGGWLVDKGQTHNAEELGSHEACHRHAAGNLKRRSKVVVATGPSFEGDAHDPSGFSAKVAGATKQRRGPAIPEICEILTSSSGPVVGRGSLPTPTLRRRKGKKKKFQGGSLFLADAPQEKRGREGAAHSPDGLTPWKTCGQGRQSAQRHIVLQRPQQALARRPKGGAHYLLSSRLSSGASETTPRHEGMGNSFEQIP